MRPSIPGKNFARVEQKGNVAVASLKGTRHQFNEDRYRILSQDVPLVGSQNRGEIFAVFDGIGSTELGMRAPRNCATNWGGFTRILRLGHSQQRGFMNC